MDRVIIKRKAENVSPVYKEMPDEEINPHTKETFPRHKKKKRRIRNEPGGIQEQMTEGLEGNRNQFKGPGTDVSYDLPGDIAGG